MLLTRLLTNSVLFADTAETWAKFKGLLDVNGNVANQFPAVIGVLDGSTDLGTFNVGIIGPNETVRQALQDLETSVNGRVILVNNLSDLPNKATARTNLGLGNAATYGVGSTGAVIPLLNGTNTWTNKQSFQVVSSTQLSVDNPLNTSSYLYFTSNSLKRWTLVKSSGTESGSNVGADLWIQRFDDSGTLLDIPFKITRATGVVDLSQPLPVTSGGTGVTSLASLKTALNIQSGISSIDISGGTTGLTVTGGPITSSGTFVLGGTLGLANGGTGTTSLANLKSAMSLNLVNNVADLDKPISTLTQAALDTKYDKTGGVVNGTITVSNNTALIMRTATAGSYPSVIHSVNTTNYYVLLSNALASPSSSYNALRPLYINLATGALGSDNGQTFTGGLTSIHNNVSGAFYGANTYNGILLVNTGISGSVGGGEYIIAQNENSVNSIGINMNMLANGSSTFEFQVNAAGDRTVNRLATILTITSTSATVAGNINAVNGNYSGTVSAVSPNNLSTGAIRILDAPGNPDAAWLQFVNNDISAQYAAIRGTRDMGLAFYNGTGAEMLRLFSGQTATLFGDTTIGNGGDLRISCATDVNTRASDTILYNDNKDLHITIGGTQRVNLANDGSLSLNNRLMFYSSSSSNYVRGIYDASNAASYGTLNTYGGGFNGWEGYSIEKWGSFMANGSEVGIHAPQWGQWLVHWTSNLDANFPANVIAYSDERLKQNIRPIDNVTLRREGLAKAAILYERDGRTRLGYGAQTLELTNPELVSTADDLMNTKSVSYMDSVAILAVDNDNLSKRIDELVLENTALQSRLKAIETHLNI